MRPLISTFHSAFLKELGDKKKEERKRAEEAFLSMLKEGDKKGIFAKEPGQIPKWSDVKKAFQKDPRYDEVGSSSLREELYDTFAKTSSHEETTKSVGSVSGHDEQHGQTTIEEERKKRREKAVKEREERVRNEKERVERENLKSRVGLSLAETELAFK
jgi:FF domain